MLFSCGQSREDAAIQRALADAGNNAAELQAVLDHYSRPEDSLRLRAAKFLIANMPVHFSYSGKEIDKYRTIFYAIDTLGYRQENVSMQDKIHLGDSLLNVLGPPDPSRVDKLPDTRTVTARYLITNIDLAFKAWRSARWSKTVSFADFCEYILPYRVREEQLEAWRPQAYQDYTRMAANHSYDDTPKNLAMALNGDIAYGINYNMSFSRYYPFPKRFSDVLMGKIGGCETTSFFSVSALRAAGLPVSSEYIPEWGNVNSGHYFVHFIDHTPHGRITNMNKPINTWSLVEWSTPFSEDRHQFTRDELPAGLYVQFIYTIPKIYRYAYAIDKDLARINQTVPGTEISPEFKGANLKDVTSEYVICSDYTWKLPAKFRNSHAAYLCAFDVSGWKPVAIVKTGNGLASFKDLGRQVIYLPAVYQNNHFIPADNPFYFDSSGSAHSLSIQKQQEQSMRLIRKTAFFAYTSYHSEVVKGGRFEASNDSLFKKTVLLDSIEKYPFYMNEAKVTDQISYRYLRYVFPATPVNESDNIAEIQFYGPDSTKPLKGSFIGSEGNAGHPIEKAFDGNLDSYYENKAGKNGWIGLDLGLAGKTKITRIKYCPRNDTNCIIPGEEYELFYWDGATWRSLGIQWAKTGHLDYANVPAGTVYWLKCISSGHEERIFTYESGRQIWW